VPPPAPAPAPTVEAPNGPPVAAVRPVTHAYHGVEVADPYEWLESPEDPEVRAWSDGQNAYARRTLAALPNVERIGAQVRAILGAGTRSWSSLVSRGGKLFAIETRPPREQPFLVVMASPDAPDAARVLVDPGQLDPSGSVAIDWFVPSEDGLLLAVSLSRGGSERGDVHVFDVESGAEVHEVVEHVNGGTAGGDLAWLPDGSGFFYTRYPREGERPAEDGSFFQQVWLHRLGTPVAGDRYEIGRDFPRIAEIQLQMDRASGRLLATVQDGDGGRFAIHLRDASGRWRRLCDFGDQIVQASFGPANDLYLVSLHDAPRGAVLRVPVESLDLARATVVVPQGEHSIVTGFFGGPMLVATRTRLLLVHQLGGPSQLDVYDLRGRLQPRIAQPDVSAITGLVPLEGERVLVHVDSFVQPGAWHVVDAARSQSLPTGLRDTSPVDAAGWQVRREMATSRDGTSVPLNVLLPPGALLDGSAPCVVTGYGGYGVNIEPYFNPLRAMYMQNGVIFVVTNLRGGGELGEDWHRAGMLTNKQNVFDDFAAVLRHVVERRYTSRDRLAIVGGSNGGLLMGATVAQHPELAHAVVSFVGIYDMLRVERSPNGAFNTTEFGTVADEAQFRALHAYSPYHAVREGTSYPALLMTTGANDPRVEPWHSRKMIARLQAANAAETPILLRTSDTSGHGMGTSLSEEIAEDTDVFAFLFSQLGVTPRAGR
jgi:prolyl oligopeptidase